MSESVRRTLITGASTNIGEATIRRLRELGWDVVAVARREEHFATLAAEMGCEYMATDLDDETAVDVLAARILEDRPMDALVNNTGSALGMNTVAHVDPGRWIAMYHRNIITTLHTTRVFLLEMRKRGGDLVFLTSTTAHDIYPGDGGYVAAKRAKRIIANTLRQELVGEPVHIIEIAPGMAKTPEFSLNRLGSKEAAAKVYEGVAELLLADDAADAICWALTRPVHMNIDSMILQPVTQTTNTFLARQG